MATDDVDTRLVDLETRAAFQDDLHEELNAIVARQDAELRELRRQVEALARRLKDLGEAMPGEAPGVMDEVPPHY
jgi:SlyX protein